jgi:hypothetical protein
MNLGKFGCQECRIQPGSKVRTNDKGLCVGCGFPILAAAQASLPPQPVRDDRGPQRPWRPSEAA